MNAQEKIKQLLIYLNINAKVFSEELGYMRPQIIYDIQKGKTKRISEDLASKIVSVFPDISKSWLLTGEGEMLKSEAQQCDSLSDRTGKACPKASDCHSYKKRPKPILKEIIDCSADNDGDNR